MTDLEDFRYNHVNLTGFRLVSYRDPEVDAILKRMRANEKRTGTKLLNSTSHIKVLPCTMLRITNINVLTFTIVLHSTLSGKHGI